MDYNEYDDYGTGWEEAAEAAQDRHEAEGKRIAREHIAARDAALAAALTMVVRCDCDNAGTQEAINALLSGRCSRCGWSA